MGVVIESDRWELHPSAFLVLFASCFASIFLLPYFSRSISGRGAVASSLFDLGHTAPFLRFQSGFLMLYALASVMQGVESVFGENDFAEYGSSREQMAWYLAMGAFAALIFGTFSGILFDILNQLVLVVSKQGHKQDLLNDTFWLMTFFESFSLIGSQGLSNLLVKGVHSRSFNSSALAAILAVLSTLYFKKEWSKSHHATVVGSYKKSFSAHILKARQKYSGSHVGSGKHPFFHVSVLDTLGTNYSERCIWADGREVNLSLIYPVLIGSRMLGSTAFPWLFSEAKLLGNEDCLMTAMGVASIALFIVAYDYQEIGVLVLLFCIFHACVGFSLPSLARLRTMYLPNELRGGMITFSLAPANAALLFVLLQGGYHRNLENSTIMALAAFGLLIASGCIYKLRSWRKMSRQNWHNI
ncbi:hypothetical protein ZIOFF_011900 [Zingiber officinale]|uniref:Uncharacterized protein n=1 Tax=Zingiber officinale TaxID=94328 RepID=A0A8J5I6X8_ZINOF|nr:hypothetical protein ZIOFF_011900 [Zingiber officinale]